MKISKGMIVYPVLLRALVIAFVYSFVSCEVSNTSKGSQASISNQQEDHKPRSNSGPGGITHTRLFDRDRWLISDSSQLWRTDDGGHTWIQSYIPTYEKGVNFYIRGISFINSNTGFLIDRNKLYSTSDSGDKWTQVSAISAGKDDYFLENCFFIDTLHGWAIGRVWREPTTSEPYPPLYEGAILATEDGGKTWHSQQLSLPKNYLESGTKWSLRNIVFTTAKKGWVVGDSVILWTVDGGITWHPAHIMDKDGVGDYRGITFLNDTFGWVTMKDAADFLITTDAGKKWRAVKGPAPFIGPSIDVTFLTQEHGFATYIHLYETLDGGRSWKLRHIAGRNNETEYRLVHYLQDRTLLVFFFENNKLATAISTDDGQTWNIRASENGK
jgi:photosystem II stability/assembly factor-like uncharacterized protein